MPTDIECQLISQRTEEALARKKAEGIKLDHPESGLSKETKLSGKEDMLLPGLWTSTG